MNTIWKWNLEITDTQSIKLPKGAQILNVQMQHGKLRLWALCDSGAPTEARRIAIYGTGNPIPDNPGIYVGTVQTHESWLVWHVFQEVK